MASTNPNTALFHSWWSIFVIAFAHLWAVTPSGQAMGIDCGSRSVCKVSSGGLLHLGFIRFGWTAVSGLLWRRALRGLGESTALPRCLLNFSNMAGGIDWCRCVVCGDEYSRWVSGLSSHHCNDLYRRTIAPIMHPNLSQQELDQRVLKISRWSTVACYNLPAGINWSLWMRMSPW